MKVIFFISAIILIGCAKSGPISSYPFESQQWLAYESLNSTKTRYTLVKLNSSSRFEHFVFEIDSSIDHRDEVSSKCATYHFKKVYVPELYFVSSGNIESVVGISDNGDFFAEKNISSDISPLDGTIFQFNPVSDNTVTELMSAATSTSIARCN